MWLVHSDFLLPSCQSGVCLSGDVYCGFVLQDEGCLPGLVVFLDNANPEVVATALEVYASGRGFEMCAHVIN